MKRSSLLVAAAVLSLGGAVGQGFGRFAYALLLEPMRGDLGWGYAQAGVINSANAVGYLAGTLLVGAAVGRWGAANTLRAGALITSLSLIGTGLLSAYPLLLLMRVLTGVGGGLVYIAGAAVVMGRAAPGERPPLGVYYSGPGLGIALSGLAVPALLGGLGGAWRPLWVAMGLFGLLALLLIEPQLRGPGRQPAVGRGGGGSWADYGLIWPQLAGFAIYGLGYIGYMTFAVAFLQSRGGGPAAVQWFWGGLGLCAVVGGPLWGGLVNRLGSRLSMALLLGALALSAALPALLDAPWAFGLSALLFGGTFLSVVTAATAAVRERLPPGRWAAATGHAVALFAVGQLLGPAVTGLVADLPGGLALGMLLSAGLLALAAAVVLLGRPAARARRQEAGEVQPEH